jgi:hypothetical protein
VNRLGVQDSARKSDRLAAFFVAGSPPLPPSNAALNDIRRTAPSCSRNLQRFGAMRKPEATPRDLTGCQGRPALREGPRMARFPSWRNASPFGSVERGTHDLYKLILDLTDGVNWPLRLQAAWLSSPA